jgi:hypothetical protein
VPDQSADQLLLRFPSRRGYLGISRLNATALAAEAGFDIVELDDVRQAVGEGVAWLLGDSGESDVEIALASSPGRLELSASLEAIDVPDHEPDDLVHAILGALTEHYRAGRDDTGRRSLHLIIESAAGALAAQGTTDPERPGPVPHH